MSYYSSSYAPWDSRPEDYGHATVTYEFVSLLHKHVGVFGATEMGRLARGFTLRLVAGVAERNENVDGTGGAKRDLLQFDGSALPFAPYESNIANLVFDSLIGVLQLHHRTVGASGVKSYAQLLRHLSKSFQLEGQAAISMEPAGRRTPSSTTGGAKVCPWGETCSSDEDCVSSLGADFTSYSAKAADTTCYSRTGFPIHSGCFRDPSTKNWIGDYWAYDFESSASTEGIACDSRSSSVWTWNTKNRQLSYCARKYKCE